MIQAAFLYVAPKCNPDEQYAYIPGEELSLTVVGVSDYEDAVKTAIQLKEKGIQAIELCAGFGSIGVAKVREAVGPEISVGAVRFDYHPAFGFKSGDEMF